MSFKLVVVASISLAQCVSLAEASLRGDPNQVGYAVDRDMSWQGWHHISGVPQWVTAWAFVALFIGIVFVFIKCGKEDFNLHPRDCLGYLTSFCLGIFCAVPCLWPPACFCYHYVRKRNQERRARVGDVQESEPAVHETDPEALPDYPDHPGYPAHTILPYNLDQTTPPDYPAQTILPDHPDQTSLLPNYTDNISPSAPPAEFATASAADIAAEEAAAAADAREAAEAAAALAAAEAAAARSGENEYEAPPSYDAAMRGEF